MDSLPNTELSQAEEQVTKTEEPQLKDNQMQAEEDANPEDPSILFLLQKKKN